MCLLGQLWFCIALILATNMTGSLQDMRSADYEIVSQTNNFTNYCWERSGSAVESLTRDRGAGLENSTCPLVFTSVSGCRAREHFDISTEN